MATTFRLTDGTLTVDMVTDDDLKLLANYLPVYPEPTGDGTIPPDITEAIPVYIYVTTDADDLAAALQDVAQLGRRAAEYAADNHQTPVWWQRKADDETNTMQALVKSVRFTSDTRLMGGPYDRPPGVCAGRTGVLTITRHPYNEATSAIAASGTNGVSVIGGIVDYTNVAGDVAARLYYLNIDNIAAARTYRRVWAGFRSDRRAGGDAANVESLWEAEDGTPDVDSAVAADATASPGGGGNTKVQCDFAGTTTWARRVAIVMSDITADYANQVGAFIVLLRAKVSGDSAQVRLRQTSNNLVVYREGPTVQISATSWTIYNLGTCEFPGRDLHATPTALFAASYDQRDILEVYARIATGTPTLDMDCLILIPADEYLIQVQSAEATTDDKIYVTVSPEDVPHAQNVDGVSSWFNIHCPVSTLGAGVPEGDGRLFICIANDNDGTAPTFSDTVDVELSYFPRYVHFRGAD